jgi:hypothetical protein
MPSGSKGDALGAGRGRWRRWLRGPWRAAFAWERLIVGHRPRLTPPVRRKGPSSPTGFLPRSSWWRTSWGLSPFPSPGGDRHAAKQSLAQGRTPWRLEGRSSKMSRTDVHVPHWVKEKDPLWRRHFVEVHNHENGTCDLHLRLEARGWIRTRCYINIHWQGRQIHCGCKMCTNQIGRRLGNRRERHDAKRAIRKGAWDFDHAHRRDAWVSWPVSSRIKRG